MPLLLPLNNSFTGKWKIVFTGYLKDDWSWWAVTWVSYTGDIKEISHSFWSRFSFTITASIDWTATAVWITFTKYSSRAWYDSRVRAVYTPILNWTDDKVKLKPRELKDLWIMASTTSFWLHIDDTFFQDLPNSNLELSNDNYNDTWYDITNFNWYIKVKVNWYYYNIPIIWRSTS